MSDGFNPNVGTLNKNGLWGFYSSTNLLGAIACFIPIYMIYQKRTKTAGDIFVCQLCIGCIMMSIPCGIQCAVNLFSFKGVFQGGKIACQLEGFFHVSAIWMQFVATGLIAWNFHNVILNRRIISLKKAFIISLTVFIFAEVSIAVLGHYSELLMMPSGAYCFYEFDSPVMLFLIGTLLICTCLIIYWYRRIYKEVKSTETKVRPKHTSQEETNRENQMTVALVFTLYIAILFFGWFPALIGTIYELVTGSMSEYLDTLVGVDGSLHSLAIPIVYLLSNQPLKDILARYPCFARCFPRQKSRSSEEKLSSGNKRIVSKQIDFSKTCQMGRHSRNASRQVRIDSTPEHLHIVIHSVPNIPRGSITILSSPFTPSPDSSPIESSGDDKKYLLETRFKNLTSSTDIRSLNLPGQPDRSTTSTEESPSPA